MDSVLLSFIIPMYNSENTIALVVESIYCQKFLPLFEIIIIDDGSTDKSASVVKKLQKDHREIKLIQQQNKKQAEARNNGLQNALGKYVCFVDSDDVLYEDYLSILLRPLIDNEKYKLSVGGIVKRNITNDTKVIENYSILQSANNDKDLINLYLTKNRELDVGLWNKIFINSVIKSYNLKFTNGNFFEDSLFVLHYLKAISVENIFFSNDIIYELAKGDSSTTTSFKSEIDRLALNYVEQVKKISIPKHVLKGFKIRIALHVIHHHIKYDESWTNTDQREIFSKFDITCPICQSLSAKYNGGAFLAWIAPAIYRKIYGK